MSEISKITPEHGANGMDQIVPSSKVGWNEIAKAGLPPVELRTIGENVMPRTFLCRGEYSLFTSYMFSDGSGFALEEGDHTLAWAIIDGF